MKLLFLYGPPAAGKLTVAQELAAQTGFKLFDNQASINAVTPVFPFGSAPFQRIVDALRDLVFEEAAEARVDLIFTFVYSRPEDDAYVRGIISLVEERGGEVLMARLHTHTQTLLQRVTSEGRRQRGKLTSRERLDRLLADHDVLSAFPERPGVALDTGILTPREAARRIVEHYRLPSAQGW